MKILLVSATYLEVKRALQHFNIAEDEHIFNHNLINVLVTGVGMTATAFSLGQALTKTRYDLAINVGIAGAFDRALQIAEVVNVGLDCFAELGAEDGDQFLTVDQLGFGKSSIKPEQAFQNSVVDCLQKVRSISVNKVHGNDESIYTTVERLNPQTESMEGAAFFYACNQAKVPCVQLRGISNYVERRNRESWKIELAVKNVNDVVIALLNNLL